MQRGRERARGRRTGESSDLAARVDRLGSSAASLVQAHTTTAAHAAISCRHGRIGAARTKRDVTLGGCLIGPTHASTQLMTNADEELQKRVLAELGWDARVLPHEIGLAVNGGVVTLLGHVDSFYKKWAAEQAAQRVRGVKAVANELDVKLPTSARRTDDEIAAAVAGMLDSAVLVAKKPQVTVSDGWVALRGEVEWNYQKQEIERLVRPLWGVKGVTNLIAVRSTTTPTELKDKIEKALLRHAELDAQRIEVEVKGSKAILKGTVRSWAEREEAERTAWTAPGITEVEDHIQVSDR
jgi:osmotically-inducible protein OsmY